MISLTNFQEKPNQNPNFRSNDRETLLRTNLLRLRINNNLKTIYVYSITFDSSVPADNAFIKRIILKNEDFAIREHYEKYIVAGDNLLSSLKVEEEKIFISKVMIEEERIYQIKINLIPDLTFDLLQRITKEDKIFKQKKTFVEILIKNILNANKLIRLRRLYFDKNKFEPLNFNSFHGNLFCGYQTAAKIAENGIFLQLSIKHKIINTKSCLEQIKKIQSHSGADFLKKLKELFVNKTVQANYGKYKFYRIDDVTIDKNVMNHTIRRKNDNGNHEEITLFQYYNHCYEKTICDKHQPLFISITKDPKTLKEESIYLIPELLLMTGLDDDIRDSDNIKRDMITKTKLDPRDRFRKIQEFRDLIYNKNVNCVVKNKKTGEMRKLPEPDEIRLQFGLEVNPNPLEVNGRIFQEPQIYGKDNREMQIRNGKVNYRDVPISSPFRFERNNWIVLCNNRNLEDADKMINSFRTCGRGLGISVEDPKLIEHRCRREEDYLEEIDKIKNLKDYSIIVIILSRNEKTFYKNIKNKVMSQYGIPSQVVLRDNFSKNLSYFTNVLNQMNNKVGGELFKIGNLHRAIKEKSMLVGLDCTKIPRSRDRNFVMVSSYDEYCSKYYTSIQTCSIEETISPTSKLLSSALKKYRSSRGYLPEYIFIYRSGSSEREKELILQYEVEAVKDLLVTYSPNYNPKLCFIVVNKKTDMKFFEGDRNPQGGTVVDTGCVNPFIYEFYIQPQYVNSGTATPTHFHVLYDSTKIPCEILQETSYQLCYYYFNWSGAIRVPAPLKYAEVCNKFISTNSIKEIESEKLKSTSYYI